MLRETCMATQRLQASTRIVWVFRNIFGHIWTYLDSLSNLRKGKLDRRKSKQPFIMVSLDSLLQVLIQTMAGGWNMLGIALKRIRLDLDLSP